MKWKYQKGAATWNDSMTKGINSQIAIVKCAIWIDRAIKSEICVIVHASQRSGHTVIYAVHKTFKYDQ